MAQEKCNIDYNAIYLAALRPEVALPTRPLTKTTDWIAGGWTRVDDPDGNDPAIWTYVYEFVEQRPAGTLMPTSQKIAKRGLATVTFSSDRIHDGTLSLVFPDASHDGEMLTADGEVKYVQMVLIDDTTVYWAKKLSASGEVAIEHSNSVFTKTPYSYKGFEDKDNDPQKKANFGIFPLLA